MNVSAGFKAGFRSALVPVRSYCTSANPPTEHLTHINHKGHAHMVDVGSKVATSRQASASGFISLSRKAFQLISDPLVSGKGDVLGVARVAGIMAAKQTPVLIPLCHSLMLSHVTVDFDLHEQDCGVSVRTCVRCEGVTGVEMEALTAVSVALLTVYDMTKSAGKGHVISRIQLDTKSGGLSGDYSRGSSQDHHPSKEGGSLGGTSRNYHGKDGSSDDCHGNSGGSSGDYHGNIGGGTPRDYGGAS